MDPERGVRTHFIQQIMLVEQTERIVGAVRW